MKKIEYVEGLTNLIKKHKDIYFAYQSNIAMAFQDEFLENPKVADAIEFKDLNEISNKAAIRFLDNWIYDSHKK